MNKKLFLAGVALLAAVGFTSCNSDTPIDSSNPSGVTPTTARHQVGGDYYDWTAIVKNLQELKDFWKDDQAAVKKLLADKKANTANILIEVAGYELKAGDVITLPDFWQTGATNGKVVNITFEGTFKNADFERASQIAGGPKLPVTIDATNLVRSEVNFTFNVEKFDLDLRSNNARSTLSGDYTIGWMYAEADIDKDALEIKEGTVEGLDHQSLGEYKGTFDGVWSKDGVQIEVASNGIKLASGKVAPGSKNVYLENGVSVDTWYNANGNKQYKLGTVKFVQKAGTNAALWLNGTDKDAKPVNDYIEKIAGFNKANCFVATLNKDKAFDNIDAVEKVTVVGLTELKKDIFTDVEFTNAVMFNTNNITSFADITFNALDVVVPANNQELVFNSVNFKNQVTLIPAITDVEQAGIEYTTYQWIVDNSTGDGHFEEVTNAKPIKDTNKDKAVKEYLKTEIDYNAGTQKFDKMVDGTDAQLKEANSSFVVTIIDITPAVTVYIPEGTTVQLNSCKFMSPATAELATTNTALNYVWGDKQLWDEQCWFTAYVDGTKYDWKKATGGTYGARFVLTPPAAAAE